MTEANKERDDITPELMREFFSYNPESGRFFYRFRGVEHFSPGKKASVDTVCAMWNKRFSGKEAMLQEVRWGYLAGSVFRIRVMAHRAAWAMAYGQWPKFIDHINGDPADNRLSNLREVEPSENTRNMSMNKRNKSGVMGVHFNKNEKKWVASIGRRGGLGYFKAKSDAVAARKAAEKYLGYHPNHGKRPSRAIQAAESGQPASWRYPATIQANKHRETK